MSNWWDKAPVAESAPKPSGDWWEAAPVADAVPKLGAVVEPAAPRVGRDASGQMLFPSAFIEKPANIVPELVREVTELTRPGSGVVTPYRPELTDAASANTAAYQASIIPERTGQNVLDDSGVAVRSGTRNVVGGLLGLPVNLGNLIADPLPLRAVRGVAEALGAGPMESPLAVVGGPQAIGQPEIVTGMRQALTSQNAEDAQEYASPLYLKQKRDLEGLGLVDTLEYMGRNPSALGMFGLEQLPQLVTAVPGKVLATIGLQGASAGSQNEMMVAAALDEAVRSGQMTQERADEIASNVFAGSAGLNTALPFLPGASVLERIAANRGLQVGTGGVARSAVKGAAGESVQGVLSEGGDQVISNIATGRPVTEGVGQAAALGLLVEGPLGAVGGAIEGAAAPKAPPIVPPPSVVPPAAPVTGVPELDAVLAEAAPEPPAPATPVAETAKDSTGGRAEPNTIEALLADPELAAMLAALPGAAPAPVSEAQATAAPAGEGGSPAPAGADSPPTLPGGFKAGPEAGTRYRVTASTGGALGKVVMLEKRNDKVDSASTFIVAKDGTLVDADSVNHMNPATKERLWVPESDKARDEATEILDQMGAIDLSDPKRKALKERLKALVTGQPDTATDKVLPESERDTAPVGSRVDGGSVPGMGRVVWEIRDVPLDSLLLPEVAPDGTIPSAGRDEDAAAYAEAMRRGERLPNARGFAGEDGRVKLADGNRRAVAARAAGLNSIPVAVATYPDQEAAPRLGDAVQSDAPAVDLNPDAKNKRLKVGQSSVSYTVDDDGAKVALIRTPKEARGQGGARAAMTEFLKATDAKGIPVTLTVAEQDKTTDPAKLQAFYESLGFTVTGQAEDGAARMTRLPGAVAAPTPAAAPAAPVAEVAPLGEAVAPPARFEPEPEPERQADRSLSFLRREVGWEQMGGRMIRGGEVETREDTGASFGRTTGDVVGRTPWVPRTDPGGRPSTFWRNRPGKLTEKEANIAFDRYEAGEVLTKRQQAFIDYAKETAAQYAEDEAAEMARVREFDQDEQLAALMALREDVDIAPEQEGEALALYDLIAQAMDNGADEIDVTPSSGETDREYAARLWTFIRGPRNVEPRATQEDRSEGGQDIADAEPAPAPARGQAGLFGPPTARETVDAARRDRDAQRDGRTGTGRTDMAAGAGELFAGPRPAQADLDRAPEATRNTRQTDGQRAEAREALRQVDGTGPRQTDADAEFDAQVAETERGIRNLRAIVSPEAAAIREKMGIPSRNVTVVDGPADLDPELRERLNPSDRAEGLFDPVTGQVFVFRIDPRTGKGITPKRAVWVAFHEVAGHLGIRGAAKKLADNDRGRWLENLMGALDNAQRNDTVKRIAAAIRGDSPDYGIAISTEEALAELAAAIRTGDYAEIESRYGVRVPMAQRNTLAGDIARLIDALRAFLRRFTGDTAFTDAEVYRLLDDAWRYAETAPVGEAGMRGSQEDAPEQRVFHGTPHNVDRFSLTKIGTGEGAQAYGWGLYFTGKRAIAEHYRKVLTDMTAPVSLMTVRGQKVDPDSPEGHGARLIAHNSKSQMKQLAKAMLADANAGDPYTIETASRQGMSPVEYYQRVSDAINSLKASDVKIQRGRVYEVDIPEDSDLLDNEGKIAAQNDKVQEIARRFLRDEGYLREGENGPRQLSSSFREAAMALGGMVRGGDGATLYEMLAKKLGGEQAASQYFNEHGVPGLKFKAGQIAGVKANATNYVIWDENAISEPVALESRRASMDGRGQRSIEHNGATFVKRGPDYYLSDANGQPQDFNFVREAEAEAQRVGGEVRQDAPTDGRRTWSVTLPEGVRMAAEREFAPESRRPDVRDLDTEPAPVKVGIIKAELDGIRKKVRDIMGPSDRPRNPQGVTERINNVRAVFFDAMMSRAMTLKARYPNSPALRQLLDTVFTEPGSGRPVYTTLAEGIGLRYATFSNRWANALASHGLTDMTRAQNKQLRDALLGINTNPPPSIRAAAESLRALMDVQAEDARAAGLEFGEVTDIGYLTRIYDDARITENAQAEADFLADAATLYREHEFPAEVGPARNMVYERDRLIAFVRIASELGDPRVRASLGRMKDALANYRRTSDLDQVRLVEREVSAIYDAVARGYGERRAAAWLHGIKTPNMADGFAVVQSPGAPMLKERVLSGAADTVMAKWMVTEIPEIMDAYGKAMSRKIEFAKQFGPTGNKVQELLDRMVAEGVSSYDATVAGRMAAQVAGQLKVATPTELSAVADWTHALGYVAMLDKAMISSLAEPITSAIRTGDIRNAFGPLVQAGRALRGLVGAPTRRGVQVERLAKAIGIVTNAGAEAVLMNQLGGDYALSPKPAKLLSKFFAATLLTRLTQSQRVYVTGVADSYLQSLAKSVTGQSDSLFDWNEGQARAELAELGIADVDTFSNWLLSQNGTPDPRNLFDVNGRPTPYGQDYMIALHRFTNQVIQNPTAAMRPEAASAGPAGRLMYGVMSFSYSFYENIMKGGVRRINTIAKRDGWTKAAQQSAIRILPTFAALAAGQIIVSTLRELVLNPERWEDMEDEERNRKLLELGLSRSFGLGGADPIIQYLTGIKYGRSAAETVIGAAPGLFLGALDRITGLGSDRNSPNTSTSEYRAAQATYSAILQPALNSMLSFTGVGPLSKAMSTAGITVGGDMGRDAFASLFGMPPEKLTQLDEKYTEARKELKALQAEIDGRIALTPPEQWQAQVDALKAEYPGLMDGAVLDVYADSPQNRRLGRAGMPKTDRNGGPVLKLEGPDGGSVLGDLEGYTRYRTENGRPRRYTTKGINDRISELNTAIDTLREDRDIAISEIGELAEMTEAYEAIDTDEVMDRSVAATTKQRRAVLDELEAERRKLKREAVDLMERAR